LKPKLIFIFLLSSSWAFGQDTLSKIEINTFLGLGYSIPTNEYSLYQPTDILSNCNAKELFLTYRFGVTYKNIGLVLGARWGGAIINNNIENNFSNALSKTSEFQNGSTVIETSLMTEGILKIRYWIGAHYNFQIGKLCISPTVIVGTGLHKFIQQAHYFHKKDISNEIIRTDLELARTYYSNNYISTHYGLMLNLSYSFSKHLALFLEPSLLYDRIKFTVNETTENIFLSAQILSAKYTYNYTLRSTVFMLGVRVHIRLKKKIGINA
jgi:hypothetical protein